MRTYLEAEAMAKSLREALAAKNVTLSHSECLDLVSKQLGFDEWSSLSVKIALESGARKTPSVERCFPATPRSGRNGRFGGSGQEVLRGAAQLCRRLGWHESNQHPLYAQVSRSGVTLHLREHRSANRTTELFIRSTGLDALKQELSRQADGCTILARRTPDDRREIQIADPFGNLLRFSENNPPGTAND